MARKITMNGHFRKSVAEVFEEFVMSKTAQGVSEITIATYRQHLGSDDCLHAVFWTGAQLHLLLLPGASHFSELV